MIEERKKFKLSKNVSGDRQIGLSLNFRLEKVFRYYKIEHN